MKNKLLYIITACLLLVSCDMSDFGDINDDPNLPKELDTRYLFNYSASKVGEFFRDDWSCRDHLYPNYMTEWRNVQQVKFRTLDYALQYKYSRIIKNLDVIIALNTDVKTKTGLNVTRLGSSKNQIAIANILRAYFYLHYTDILGDIPYSEANKGKENYFPKYDKQELIYNDLYKKLTDAINGFDTGDFDADSDAFFSGDLAKWKKFGNSIRMIMALRLSKVDEAKGKLWFTDALANAAGYISSNEDNFVFKFKKEYDADYSDNNNVNPIWENVVQDGRDDYKPTEKIVNYMKQFNDPRLPAYFTKSKKDSKYVGVPFGILKSEISKYPVDSLSSFNPKFIAQDASITLLSAAQIHFTLAEAIERGWIAGTAATEYNSGIKCSITQHAIEVGITTYTTQAGVTYGNFIGDVNSRIKQIAQQKWLAMYMQDGWEAWAEYRRLGWPEMSIGKSTKLTAIPRRLKYHSDDFSSNMESYNAVVASQGANEVTTRIWWDKE